MIVSIFEGECLLGSYERKHPGWGESTFHPFERDGKWYALYSEDYTRTRVMSLPECQDIGGEEPTPNGFCPVEYYVPCYRTVSWTDAKTGTSYARYEFDNAERHHHHSEAPHPMYRYGPWQFLKTAFVAGCHWGDDSCWKVEVIDLTGAGEGFIKRSALLGHFELPHGKPLKDCIDFLGWTPEDPVVKMIRQELRDLNSGAIVDPYER